MNGFTDKQDFHRQLHCDVRAGKHAVTQRVALVPVIVLRILLLRFENLVDKVNIYQTAKLRANCSILYTDIVFSLLLREVPSYTVDEKLFEQVI